MAPILYYHPRSSPSRSAHMCCLAIGLDVNIKPLDFTKNENKTPEYLKKNPLHCVPLLEEEDGFIVGDSHAIMGYLINEYAKDKSLYPSEPRKRAIVDHRLHFDCDKLFGTARQIAHSINSGVKEIPKNLINGLQEALEITEIYLESNQYIAGDKLTIADFSFVVSVLTASVYTPLEPSKYPKILAWLKKMQALPYYDEANTKGFEDYRERLTNKLKANQRA